jgi:nucleoid DNA-binding protein
VGWAESINGEEAEMEERKVVTFKPSRLFREAVDGKKEEM